MGDFIFHIKLKF